ncbi:MAG: hypothetical protein K8R60_20580 [Burkholderiales bacterium]|nr:hypothetical protein [Burkholderiales bacterium]
MRPVHCVALLSAALALPVLAKLPPQTDEAKAAAAETAAKAAWVDKVGAYKLCLAQDRVADGYKKSGKTASSTAASAVPMAAPASGAAPLPVVIPTCADPGPYVAAVTPAVAKPLEAAGAHSPPGPAVSPPNTKATSAQISPKK